MKDVKIDFVVPWVDGSDPEWLAEKAKYDQCVVDDGAINSEQRYRDWGLMKYWFRGVEKFAPWVRKIHFITWGHVPEFLDVSHPKIHIVNHKDFIPEDCLPTYNASAFETVLHKIPDLAEHFVFFNDDTFLISKVQKEDFFKNGLPCAYYRENPCCFYGNSIYGRMVYNALCIINQHFDKRLQMKKNWKKWFSQPFWSKSFLSTLLSSPWPCFLGFSSPHLPSSFLKSTWDRVWNLEYDTLNDTLHSKFRKSENVQQELFRYWQFVEGLFEPQKLIGEFYSLRDENVDVICNAIRHGKYKELCINDGNVSDFEHVKRKISLAFENILPTNSSFEK